MQRDANHDRNLSDIYIVDTFDTLTPEYPDYSKEERTALDQEVMKRCDCSMDDLRGALARVYSDDKHPYWLLKRSW